MRLNQAQGKDAVKRFGMHKTHTPLPTEGNMLFHGLTMGFFFYLIDVCVCVSGHVCVQICACMHSCMSVCCVYVCLYMCSCRQL